MFFSRFYEILIVVNLIIVGISFLIIFNLFKTNKTEKEQETHRGNIFLIFNILLILIVITNSLFLSYMIDNLDANIEDNNGIASILKERLPDQQTQEIRHQELISAIKDFNLIPSGQNSSINQTIPTYLIYSIIIIIALGIFFMVVGFIKKSSLLTVGSILEAAALLSVSISNLNLNFTSTTQYPNFNMQSMSYKNKGIINGFESGIDTVASFKPDSVFKNIFNGVEISKINSLILIGGVDKNPLKGTARAVYGDNLGLAMSRANWVKKKLLSYYKCDLDTSKIIVLGKGPNHIGLNISSGLKSKDRCVTVYVSQSKPNTNKVNNKIDE